jgi:cell division protein ZapA
MPQLAEPTATEELFAPQSAKEQEQEHEEKQLSAQQQRSAAEVARESSAVVVDIYDQVYQLRGTDPEYIEQLAAIVDGKMRAVSAHGATVDSLRVAVLAALNIADELLTLRARYEAMAGSLNQQQTTVRSRAGSLMGMLDEVLEERKAG